MLSKGRKQQGGTREAFVKQKEKEKPMNVLPSTAVTSCKERRGAAGRRMVLGLPLSAPAQPGKD